MGENEARFLRGRMLSVGVSPEAIEKVMAFDRVYATPAELLGKQEGPTPEQLHLVGAFMVYEGLGCALAKGELKDDEIKVAREIAKTLYVSDATVDQIVDVVRKENDVRTARIALLGGSEYKPEYSE